MRIKAGRIWLTTWKTCSRTSEKNIKLFLVKYLAPGKISPLSARLAQSAAPPPYPAQAVYGVLQPTLREERARLVRAVARTMQKTGGTLLQGQATGTRPQAQQGRTRFPVVRQRTPPCIRSPQWPLA